MLPALRHTNMSPGSACMICSGATRLSAQEIMGAFGLWPSATSFANRSVRLGKTRFSKSNTRPMRSFMKPLLAGWFHAHGDRILLRCSVNVTKCCSSGRKAQACGQTAERSEEHTSELQSLMRISYAVFCLKKNNERTNKKTQQSK